MNGAEGISATSSVPQAALIMASDPTTTGPDRVALLDNLLNPPPPPHVPGLTPSLESLAGAMSMTMEDALDTPLTSLHSRVPTDVDTEPDMDADIQQQPTMDAYPEVEMDADGEPDVEGDGEERQLNVTDALSYLDAVKIQFADRPDVYNHFLDIMKDFKSQQIDTPGVIERVSSLFTGHPALIQGFNTFLPVGYRIECTTTPRGDGALITVTTPTGTTTQRQTHSVPQNHPLGISSPAPRSTPVPMDDAHVRLNARKDMMSEALEPPRHGHQGSNDSGHAHPSQAYAGETQTMNIEPALEFVQMLKRRYSPEMYHQFLDLLQAPQRDQNEVFAKVESMLTGEPDLITKFRSIMFDSTTPFSSLDDPTPPAHSSSRRERREHREHRDRDRSDKHKDRDRERDDESSNKRKRRGTDREKEREAEKPPTKVSRRGTITGGTSSNAAEASSSKKKLPGNSRSHREDHSSAAHPTAGASGTAPDPTRFFERVKKALDARETYHEFLRLCALFAADALDRARLVREARTYLAQRPDLQAQLEELLEWDSERDRMDPAEVRWANTGSAVGGGSTWPTGAGATGGMRMGGWAELNVKYGSYRRLPEHERNPICSGRDDMCKSVLNDEWVSHPSFASDPDDPASGGFANPRKGPWEDALHRTEEERHEYDFHLDALARTIAVLEPLAQRVAAMPPTERATVRLRPALGGTGKALHQRVIRKIYGRQAGADVLRALHDQPALAAPVVLSRLKQKEDEWKRARAAWARVWREVDARAFPRSLDRRAGDQRTTDKRALAPRTLVAQIEAARAERRAARAGAVYPGLVRARRGPDLAFEMTDPEVLQDGLKLCFGLLDRMNSLPLAERKKVEAFLRAFVPTFIGVDASAFNAPFGAVRALVEAQDDAPATNGDAPEGRKRGGRGGDLRKKTLKSEAGKSARRRGGHAAATPPANGKGTAVDPRAMLTDGLGSQGGSDSVPAGPPRRHIFFANSGFYVLLRLIEIMYSRISAIKITAEELGASQPAPVASIGGEQATISAARDESSATLNASVAETGGPNQKPTAAQLYATFLASCERLFDGELEPLAFEDMIREMFGNKVAYQVFTLDKILGALIKQVQTLLADVSLTMKLLELLKAERASPVPFSREERARYLWDTRAALPDENLFRIDWDNTSGAMGMQLLGKDEDEGVDEEVLFERWQTYVDAFVSTDAQTPTTIRARPPFLQRSLKGADRASADVLARGGLGIKVCVRTYRLFFVPGSEDVLVREPEAEEARTVESVIRKATQKRKGWIEDLNRGVWNGVQAIGIL